ncbi:MAG: hypothetical protein R3263_00330 [Myxococcota bacterium]|nr:hypothetical protein [Myxococcota bacterium]
MSESVLRELERIARLRRAVGVEALALGAAVSLTAWAVRLGAGEAPETAALLLLGLVGLAGGSLRFLAALAGLLGEACPRCGDAFFLSVERLVWSLPYPRGRCAHCGVTLDAPRPDPEGSRLS